MPGNISLYSLDTSVELFFQNMEGSQENVEMVKFFGEEDEKTGPEPAQSNKEGW